MIEALACAVVLVIAIVRHRRRGVEPLWSWLVAFALGAGLLAWPPPARWPVAAARLALAVVALAIVERVAVRAKESASHRARVAALALAALLALAPLLVRVCLGRPTLVRHADAFATSLARARRGAF